MDAQARVELDRLMTRLADGDRDAFDPFFVRVWPLVRGLAQRMIPGADGDDAAQEAMLRVFARAGEYDASRPALTWVLGITAWECRTVRRRRGRRREVSEAVELACAHTPEDELVRAGDARALDEALAALGPGDGAVVQAALRGERDGDATFRKRLSRAVARLRAALWRRHDLS